MEVARMWDPSGNQQTGIALNPAGRAKAWVSPVSIWRRYKPVLSEKTRYLPSGEIVAPLTGSSLGFAVKRRSETDVDGDNIGATRRPMYSPAPNPINSR